MPRLQRSVEWSLNIWLTRRMKKTDPFIPMWIILWAHFTSPNLTALLYVFTGCRNITQIFQTGMYRDSHNPLPDKPIFGSSNSAANKDMMSKIWTNGDAIIWLSRKHCGKWRNCLLWAIFPFPTMFSKAVISWYVKMSIYGVKGYLFIIWLII